MLERARIAATVALAAWLAALPTSEAQAQVPTLKTQPVTVPAAVKSSLAGKTAYDPARMAKKISYRADMPLLQLSATKKVALDPITLSPRPLTPALVVKAKTLSPTLQAYSSHITQTPYVLSTRPALITFPPARASHRARQTPIKDQLERHTCTAFAAMAGLEAFYKRKFNKALNLSEEHAFFIFNDQLNRPPCSDVGFVTTDVAPWLITNNVCSETNFAYDSDGLACGTTTPAVCTQNQNWGLETVEYILSEADAGGGTLHARNTNYLESILAAGNEIVYGLHVAGAHWDNGRAETGVIDVQVQANGEPAPSAGGHAVVLVGYDRGADYFEFKNSWGTDRGHDGYFRVTYEYLQVYGKYGFYITAVDEH